MKLLRPLTFASTVSLSLVVTACGGGFAGGTYDAQTQTTNARMAEGCHSMIDQALAVYCVPENEAKWTKVQNNPMKQQARTLRQACGAQASLAPKLAEADACAARLDASVGQENEAQAARLPAAREKVPVVRAEAEYASRLEIWKSAAHAVTVTGDNWEVARREHNPRVFEYQGRWEDAKRKEAAAAASMRRLFERHGIDPRDARVLGLW